MYDFTDEYLLGALYDYFKACERLDACRSNYVAESGTDQDYYCSSEADAVDVAQQRVITLLDARIDARIAAMREP